MAIPSQALFNKEGVETLWQTSQVDEEKVQTTNISNMAVKTVVGKHTLQVVGSNPTSATIFKRESIGSWLVFLLLKNKKVKRNLRNA